MLFSASALLNPSACSNSTCALSAARAWRVVDSVRHVVAELGLSVAVILVSQY